MNSQNQILDEYEFSKIFSEKLIQKVENLKNTYTLLSLWNYF